MQKWLQGIPYEVAFWNSVYANKRELKALFSWSSLNKEIHLSGFDVTNFLNQQDAPIVLDVGAGLSFAPGNLMIRNGSLDPINIHYIDPLAHFFNTIARKNKVQVPLVEFGMMEYLSAFYPNKDVSLIIIQNALDHSSNPIKGILESIECLTDGGVLYLNHHLNEAEFENYRGFHQFNIDIRQTDLVIWNKHDEFNVSKMLADFADVNALMVDGAPIAIITKKTEVPKEFITDKEDIRYLCTEVLEYAETMSNFQTTFIFQIKYLWFSCVQWVCRYLSADFKRKIKDILRKL